MQTIDNPDLTVVEGSKSLWTHADNRRHGFHNLATIARYGMSFRAARVMRLEKRMDLCIANLDAVRHYTTTPWFSGMVVIRDQHVLFERYSSDFGPDRLHSIQSITKTTMNLVIGYLVEAGKIELESPVKHYIPQIGSGYANATVQQVLNMDVGNSYSEDFADPRATYYAHEEAMGWRLPSDPMNEPTQRRFLSQIKSAHTKNPSGYAQYKDANTDVLAWVAERASGRPLRAFLADITDAAGLEGAFFITTDREGFPGVDGGGCMTARDLARYFALFTRGGRGVGGESVGSAAFIERTLRGGVPMAPPYDRIRYSNQMMVCGPTLGHGGWGGQYVLADLNTRTVAVFLSVIENEHASTNEYRGPIIEMLESITRRAK